MSLFLFNNDSFILFSCLSIPPPFFISPDNQDITTCYGSRCRAPSSPGYFESPNYPNLYTGNYRGLYLLYIPGAAEIRFSVYSPLEVLGELYVGSGLSVDFNQLQQRSIPPDLYYVFGTIGPNPFTLSTDRAFVYFRTGPGSVGRGFRLRWDVVRDVGKS